MRVNAVLALVLAATLGAGCSGGGGGTTDAGGEFSLGDLPRTDADATGGDATGGDTAATDTTAASDLCPAGWAATQIGTFSMGDKNLHGANNNAPVHPVTLTRPMCIQTTETTQADFKAITGGNPSTATSCGDQCPVESVSWWDALEYCNLLSDEAKLEHCYEMTGCTGNPGVDLVCTDPGFKGLDCKGFRLPTEAEWEYAARAGTTTDTYNGDLDSAHTSCQEPNPVLDPIAWFCGNSGSAPSTDTMPHAVGTKQANAWGLSDTLGNVGEWVWDWYGDLNFSPATDPLGADTGKQRVCRGGWFSLFGSGIESPKRTFYDPTLRKPTIGFRVVRTIPCEGALAQDPAYCVQPEPQPETAEVVEGGELPDAAEGVTDEDVLLPADAPADAPADVVEAEAHAA